MTDNIVTNNSGVNSTLQVNKKVLGCLPVAPVHGHAIQYDSTSDTYKNGTDCYIDLIGELTQRSAGGGALPMTLTAFDLASRIWTYATTSGAGQVSQFFMAYHWPHAYKPGSDTFIHLHIGTNLSITTTTSFQVFACFAKRGQIVPVMTQLQNITYTFQGASDLRRHIVVEVPLSTSGGSANTLDSSTLETDGILYAYFRYERGLAPDNMANSPTFVFTADCHILTDMGSGTKNKEAPFRT